MYKRQACDSQRVTANGRSVKASYDVKVGDVLEFRFGERVTRVEVLAVSEHAGKDLSLIHISPAASTPPGRPVT